MQALNGIIAIMASEEDRAAAKDRVITTPRTTATKDRREKNGAGFRFYLNLYS